MGDKHLILVLTIFMLGCGTTAKQSEDGLTLSIKGTGSAKFENGAEITGGTWIPTLPNIEIDQ